MNYSIWQLILFFFLYSVGGWLVLTAIRSVQNTRLVNVGVLDGPVSPSIGGLMTICIWLVGAAKESYLWQYMLCVVVCLAVLSMEKRVSMRIVNQSFHGILLQAFGRLGKYAAPVCYLTMGLVAFVICNMLQPFLLIAVDLIPGMILFVLDIALMVIFVIDMITSGLILQRFRSKDSKLQKEVTQGLDDARENLAKRFVHMIYRRLIHAYPEMGEGAGENGKRSSDGYAHVAELSDVDHIKSPNQDRVFAGGMSLTKLFWIFLICALLGDLIETVYCGVVDGKWMSRSSFLYGPLSMVWGGGAALGIAILEPFTRKNDRWIFFGGFLIGGAYEYLCSVFTEVVFGQVFWDYSDFPLNIGGRTNVLFMFFWGVAALVLLKFVYPKMCYYIEKIKPLPGLILTWILVILLVLDMLITGLALMRYNLRRDHPKASNQVEAYLDTRYPDKLIEKRWRNMHRADPETEHTS